MRRTSQAAILLVSFALSGCQCIDPEQFGVIPDAGTVVPPPSPDPPKFPLKGGDILLYKGVGGRNGGTCAGTPGDCERTLRATYTVNSVTRNAETNRWKVNADFLYEMTVANVDIAVIDPLFVSGAGDFDLDVQGASDGTADFTTDGAPIDDITANEFPFFHYETAYAGVVGSSFDVAAKAFRDRIAELDADADIDTKAAAATMEAYFKDDRVQPAQLHKIRVQMHQMGFMCAWDERMIPWTDGMNRAESDFNGQEAGLTAVFITPNVIRDDVEYRCACSTLGAVCKGLTDQTKCLDPSDADADPITCP